MRVFLVSGIALACAVALLAQTPAESPIKVRGCLQGDGSAERPWILAGVVLPAPVTAPPPGGGGGGGGGGRGGRGGAAPPAQPAPPPPPPPQPQVTLRLSGVNMSPWRGMRVELEGSLVGARPASGPQEFRVATARSAYGDCPAK